MSILRWGNPAEVLASMPAMLPQLKVPTLILPEFTRQGYTRTVAQRACALISQSKVVMVDWGHFIPLNNPEVVAAELLRFFAETATSNRQAHTDKAGPAIPYFSPSTVPAN